MLLHKTSYCGIRSCGNSDISKKKEKNFSLVICGDMRKQGRTDEIINELIEKEDL